ncbi:MAG: hypothetical protein JXA00_01790 [Candidatus Thermoplasmatota archaeon]|nr:hypothetical protein [Candidatus Thermoplasmatota archaeon]
MKKVHTSLSIAVIFLFVGVAVAPSLPATVDEPLSEAPVDPTLKASFARLIQAVPPREEVETFKDNPTYLRNIQKRLLSVFENEPTLLSFLITPHHDECGCDGESGTVEWTFPLTCLLLLPVFLPILYIWIGTHGYYGSLLMQWINMVGKPLHCFWFVGLLYDYPPMVCLSLDYIFLGVMLLWELTIGNLNLLVDFLFPNLNINIYLGWHLIEMILALGLKMNCPMFT